MGNQAYGSDNAAKKVVDRGNAKPSLPENTGKASVARPPQTNIKPAGLGTGGSKKK
jgi:hypothetical protein